MGAMMQQPGASPRGRLSLQRAADAGQPDDPTPCLPEARKDTAETGDGPR